MGGLAVFCQSDPLPSRVFGMPEITGRIAQVMQVTSISIDAFEVNLAKALASDLAWPWAGWLFSNRPWAVLKASIETLPRCVRHDSQEEVGLLLEFVARSRSHEVLHPIQFV
jgi:hypothetical protein